MTEFAARDGMQIQDALVAALEQWPQSGVPDNPGAWLTAVAKRRYVDGVPGARGFGHARQAARVGLQRGDHRSELAMRCNFARALQSDAADRDQRNARCARGAVRLSQ